MEDERNSETPPARCCGGGSDPGQETDAAAACCDCGAPLAVRSWIKTLIFVVVMAAAVGVGAYSLVSGSRVADEASVAPGGGPGSPAAVAGQPAPNSPAPGSPSCCAAGSGVVQAGAPSCPGAGSGGVRAGAPSCGSTAVAAQSGEPATCMPQGAGAPDSTHTGR